MIPRFVLRLWLSDCTEAEVEGEGEVEAGKRLLRLAELEVLQGLDFLPNAQLTALLWAPLLLRLHALPRQPHDSDATKQVRLPHRRPQSPVMDTLIPEIHSIELHWRKKI